MARMMIKVLGIVVACMVLAASSTEGLTCGDVVSKLTPCLNYLKGSSSVSSACCKGVKGLKAAAKTHSEKKTACGCMKSAYKAISGIKDDHALSLPKKCGVDIPYKITPNTDCTKVK